MTSINAVMNPDTVNKNLQNESSGEEIASEKISSVTAANVCCKLLTLPQGSHVTRPSK
jgi:hypothetical protein